MAIRSFDFPLYCQILPGYVSHGANSHSSKSPMCLFEKVGPLTRGLWPGKRGWLTIYVFYEDGRAGSGVANVGEGTVGGEAVDYCEENGREKDIEGRHGERNRKGPC